MEVRLDGDYSRSFDNGSTPYGEIRVQSDHFMELGSIMQSETMKFGIHDHEKAKFDGSVIGRRMS